MRVLAMASQKGGSGKTTLSGHLAVQAQLAGAGPVCLIDIDPQGSLADWWNERTDDMPAFAQTTVARLSSDLEVLRTRHTAAARELLSRLVGADRFVIAADTSGDAVVGPARDEARPGLAGAAYAAPAAVDPGDRAAPAGAPERRSARSEAGPLPPSRRLSGEGSPDRGP